MMTLKITIEEERFINLCGQTEIRKYFHNLFLKTLCTLKFILKFILQGCL